MLNLRLTTAFKIVCNHFSLKAKFPVRLVKSYLYIFSFQMLLKEISPATVFKLILKSLLTWKTHASLYCHSYI